jgi:hypothetical protein
MPDAVVTSERLIGIDHPSSVSVPFFCGAAYWGCPHAGAYGGGQPAGF